MPLPDVDCDPVPVERVLVVLRPAVVLRAPPLPVDLRAPVLLLLLDDLEALLDLLPVVRLAVLSLLADERWPVVFFAPLADFEVPDLRAVLADFADPDLLAVLRDFAAPDFFAVELDLLLVLRLALVDFLAVARLAEPVPRVALDLPAWEDVPPDLAVTPAFWSWLRLLRTSVLMRFRVSSRICRLSRAFSMIRSTVSCSNSSWVLAMSRGLPPLLTDLMFFNTSS